MMDFADALRAMKKGKRVMRKGWNGKGMFIEIHASPYLTHDPHPITSELFIHIKNPQGSFVPWVARQADLLMDDWEIAEKRLAVDQPIGSVLTSHQNI